LQTKWETREKRNKTVFETFTKTFHHIKREIVFSNFFRFFPQLICLTLQEIHLGHTKLDFSFPSVTSWDLDAGGRPISIIYYFSILNLIYVSKISLVPHFYVRFQLFAGNYFGHTLLEFIAKKAKITCFLVVLLLFYIIFVVSIKIFAHFKTRNPLNGE
jgi:hypothetical protein